jgi:hypothetical protein
MKKKQHHDGADNGDKHGIQIETADAAPAYAGENESTHASPDNAQDDVQDTALAPPVYHLASDETGDQAEQDPPHKAHALNPFIRPQNGEPRACAQALPERERWWYVLSCGRRGYSPSRKGQAMKTVLVGALMGAMLATPVLAASGDACLQHNRILSLRALDDRTVLATDRNYHRYTIHMNAGCIGLDNAAAHLVFRTWQNLACVDRGDIIGVQAPGLGFVTCSVAGVQAGSS